MFIQAARALALHRLARHGDARVALTLSERTAEDTWYEPAEDQPVTYTDLQTFIDAKILLQEAREALHDGPQAEPPRDGSHDTADEQSKPSERQNFLDRLSSDDSKTRMAVEALKQIQNDTAATADFDEVEVVGDDAAHNTPPDEPTTK